MTGSKTANGIEHGNTLVEFTDAVLVDDEHHLDQARNKAYLILGAEGFVDAAAYIASFNSIVLVANATGTRLDRLVTDQLEQLSGDNTWLHHVPRMAD